MFKYLLIEILTMIATVLIWYPVWKYLETTFNNTQKTLLGIFAGGVLGLILIRYI